MENLDLCQFSPFDLNTMDMENLKINIFDHLTFTWSCLVITFRTNPTANCSCSSRNLRLGRAIQKHTWCVSSCHVTWPDWLPGRRWAPFSRCYPCDDMRTRSPYWAANIPIFPCVPPIANSYITAVQSHALIIYLHRPNCFQPRSEIISRTVVGSGWYLRKVIFRDRENSTSSFKLLIVALSFPVTSNWASTLGTVALSFIIFTSGANMSVGFLNPNISWPFQYTSETCPRS